MLIHYYYYFATSLRVLAGLLEFWVDLSLNEQHICIVVWPLFQIGNKGPSQNLHPVSMHYQAPGRSSD